MKSRHIRDSKKPLTRSIYIDEDILSEIKKRADKNGETVNATISKMLREMNMVMNVRDYSHTLGIPDHLLHYFLKNIDEQIIILYAEEKGQIIFSEVLQRTGALRDFSTFRMFVRDGYCKCSNWASYSEETSGDKIRMILTHERGGIWSEFMRGYFKGGMEEFFGRDAAAGISLSVVETGLIITLPSSITKDARDDKEA